ncbi:TRAP transporter large permease subunit [Cupriavidus pinatubonensis]|uniref:TRAP transporter large permease subunit n=1 Tax=Cupriavidus pinatubonensis TaxID=248026 RepID=UPI0031450B6E
MLTPTEAAGGAAVIALLVACLISRGLRWRPLCAVFLVSAKTTAVVCLHVCECQGKLRLGD